MDRGQSPFNHFDGERFIYPWRKRTSRGRFAFWRWKFSGQRAEWPEKLEPNRFDEPPERVDGQDLRLSYVGHATFLIQIGGLNILTDPFWSERASPLRWAGPKRVVEPGIRFSDLPPIDTALVSHNHYDHMDLPTLHHLHDQHGSRIVSPLGNAVLIGGKSRRIPVDELDWGQSLALSENVRVHCEPAQHWSRRRMKDRNRALWCAYVIEGPAGRVYFAGDTGYGEGEHFRHSGQRFGGFRVALLPIGAYAPRWMMEFSHMNPEEAVLAHHDLQAETSIAMHHATIQLTDEPIHEPVERLTEARETHGLSSHDFRILGIGEVASFKS